MFHRMETMSTNPYTLSRHRTADAAFAAIAAETKRLHRTPGMQNNYLMRAVWEIRPDGCHRVIYDADGLGVIDASEWVA